MTRGANVVIENNSFILIDKYLQKFKWHLLKNNKIEKIYKNVSTNDEIIIKIKDTKINVFVPIGINNIVYQTVFSTHIQATEYIKMHILNYHNMHYINY